MMSINHLLGTEIQIKQVSFALKYKLKTKNVLNPYTIFVVENRSSITGVREISSSLRKVRVGQDNTFYN